MWCRGARPELGGVTPAKDLLTGDAGPDQRLAGTNVMTTDELAMMVPPSLSTTRGKRLVKVFAAGATGRTS